MNHALNPFVYISFLASVHCRRSCLRPLVSAPLWMLSSHWNSSWLSCCCPVLQKSCSFGSAGPVSSCASTCHRWGQHIALNLGLGRSAYLSSPIFATRVATCIALVISPFAIINKGWGQFSCFHVHPQGHISLTYTYRASPTVLCVAHAWHRCHSPECCSR